MNKKSEVIFCRIKYFSDEEIDLNTTEWLDYCKQIGNTKIEQDSSGRNVLYKKVKNKKDKTIVRSKTFGAISIGLGYFSFLTIIFSIIGGFSILVGGFGIANIMFVSVRERTGEIGIQKALGAKNFTVLIQFLTESILLCIIGGIVGLFLVYIASYAAGKIFEFDIFLSIKNIVVGLEMSVAIGLLSGLIPAWMASRLAPIEAIRMEV